MRDLDIDMFYDKEKDEFYCIRCIQYLIELVTQVI